MENLVARIEEINTIVNNFAWGPVMLILLVGTGIYLTVRTGCVQLTKFGFSMRHTVGTLFSGSSRDHGENLSPFQAVTTALAGTVGTGNIAGVTGAIFTGGPGAVFWMWFSAFFGMFTKFAEIALAIKYREVDENGVHHGGPMYYIKNGLGSGWGWLAAIFAFIGGLASFGIGNIAQSNEIAGAMLDIFHIGPVWTGILLAFIVAIVILGGVKRIGTVTSYLVWFISIFYVLAGIFMIITHIPQIPGVLWLIVKEAFSFRAVGGGVFGYAIMLAMRQGCARGVFSNEAGLGSAPIAHAASSTDEPCEQAMWGIFEVFVDTIVICSITSLAVLLSGVYTGSLADYTSKGAAAAEAFNSMLPGSIGGFIIEVSLIFFALSTILGWSYYGASCWEYLTHNKTFVMVYKVIFSFVCIIGAVGSGQLVWDISDTLNGLMAIPNLIALLLLSGVIISMTKEYFENNID